MSSIERLSMTPEQYEAAKADILERIKEPLVSKPDDFRSHTCGACAWATEQVNTLIRCRHVGGSDFPWLNQECIACPAYVPREKGATK